MKLICNFIKLIYLIFYSLYFHLKNIFLIFKNNIKKKSSREKIDFLNKNKNFWKNNPIAKKKIIITDFVHQIGFTLSECILGKYIQNIFNYEYQVIGLLDSHDLFGKKIFKSYSVNDFIEYPRINIINRIKYILTAFKILKKYKNVEEFLEFSYGEINIGKAVYDHILRNTGIASTNKINIKFYFFLSEALYCYQYFLKIFKTNNFDYMIMSEIQFLPSNIIFQLALSNNIKVVSRLTGPKKIGVRLYNTQHKKFETNIKISNELFNMVYESESEKYSEEGFDIINKVFKGEITHYDRNSIKLFKNKNQTNLDSFYKELDWERSKKVCTVFGHNLLDGNFNNEWRIFKDNLTWLRETLHFIKDSKQDINWLIKEHPSEYGKKKASTSTFEEFEKIIGHDVKNIKFFPNKFNSRILKDVTNFALTSFGSAGLEYPCFGIPSMVSGDCYYHGFGIPIEPNNSDEYFKNLGNLEKLIQDGLSIDRIKRAKVLFFILQDVIKMEHPLLFEFDISRDLNIDSFFREMTNLIDNYDLENDFFKINLKNQIVNKNRHLINEKKLKGK